MSDQKPRSEKIPQPEQDSVEGENNSGRSQSIASRISHSVSSLSRDVLAGRSGSSTSALASSLAGLGKSEQPSASAASASAGPSTWTQSRRLGLDNLNGRAEHSALETGFRRARPGEVDSELDNGGYGGGGRVGPIPPSNLDYRVSSWTGQFQTSHATAQSDDISVVEQADGLEIVDLLSDYKALGDGSMLEADFEGAEEVSADDLFSQQLSGNEQDIKAKMMALLPLPPEHGSIDPLNPRNFVPNVEMLHMPTSTMYHSLLDSSNSDVSHFSSFVDRTRWMRQWLNEWDDVLHNYTDEVWGISLPQVKEARKEIEEMKNNKDSWEDRQALRRLAMILGHIKPPASNSIAASNGR